ncbi:MAG: hypothetical protein WC551_08880 [Patescibacteria group bacterium]
MDENETVDAVLNGTLVSTPDVAPAAAPEPPAEVAETPAKRHYNSRGDGEAIRQRIAGYVLCNLAAGEAVSVGQLSLALGIEAVVVGYHARALAAEGKIKAQGEKRGRKYTAVLS